MVLVRVRCNVRTHFIFNKVLCKLLQIRLLYYYRKHTIKCTTALISLFKAYTFKGINLSCITSSLILMATLVNAYSCFTG
nr:MAG TPA: hypothetical protein [Bacteriophage sp.]